MGIAVLRSLPVRAGAFALAFAVAFVVQGSPAALGRVTVSSAAMNPSAGDSARITVEVHRDGRLMAMIVDRDGFPVRELASATAVNPGSHTLLWDGRNERGEIVPDEAYSLRIVWSDGARAETYFPAASPAAVTSLDPNYYSARTGALVYTLPVASRVHLQAGVASPNGRTGEFEGPVLKTIVNREPRLAGRIAEPWNGFDESGTIHVSEMHNFVLALAVAPLPENSVITYGNRRQTFAVAAVSRSGQSLFDHASGKHEHHRGLSVLDDVSPALRIEPLGATWSEEQKAWRVRGKTTRLRVTVTGPSSEAFIRHPGRLYRFIDGKPAGSSPRPSTTAAEIEVPLGPGRGVQNVAINWRSDYGPLAANSVRIVVDAGGR